MLRSFLVLSLTLLSTSAFAYDRVELEADEDEVAYDVLVDGREEVEQCKSSLDYLRDTMFLALNADNAHHRMVLQAHLVDQDYRSRVVDKCREAFITVGALAQVTAEAAELQVEMCALGKLPEAYCNTVALRGLGASKLHRDTVREIEKLAQVDSDLSAIEESVKKSWVE